MNTITEDIKAGAENYRKAQGTRKPTTAQLPVFRECANLLYMVMKEMYHAPMTDIRKDYWRQVLNSYFGFLTQTNEYRARGKILKMFPSGWFRYFSIINRRKVTIKNSSTQWKNKRKSM